MLIRVQFYFAQLKPSLLCLVWIFRSVVWR